MQPLLSFDPSLRLCVYNDAALPYLASHMQQKVGDITLSARCGEAKVEALAPSHVDTTTTSDFGRSDKTDEGADAADADGRVLPGRRKKSARGFCKLFDKLCPGFCTLLTIFEEERISTCDKGRHVDRRQDDGRIADGMGHHHLSKGASPSPPPPFALVPDLS